MNPPDKVWAFVSGGKDSTAAAIYLKEIGKLNGIAFFHTGISVPNAIDPVRKLAERLDVILEEYTTPVIYEEFVKKYHFARPGTHRIYVAALKGRCVRQFKKAHPGEWAASGVRTEESSRRAIQAAEFGKWEGVSMWAPILTWSDSNVWNYLRDKDFEPSPASRILGYSGECLCGAYGKRRDELPLLRAFYPEVAQRITHLEDEIGEQWGKKGKNRDPKQNRIDSGELWGCGGLCSAYFEEIVK